MCGIMVKSSFKVETDYNKFIKATNTLKSRGPDEFGYVFTPKYSLGNRRLVILDKEHGKQPMMYNDSFIVYNGEIYNLDELKVKLTNNGVELHGYGDTEVLLKYFKTFGITHLNDFVGMYAFAIADEDKIIAVRDKAGVKPLFYSVIDGEIIVASEIKAILEYMGKAVVSKDGLQELLGLAPAYTIGKTFYDNIFELPPGSYLEFDNSGLRITKYYSLKAKTYTKTYEECVSDVKNLVTNSINSQLNADGSICCFLSGGLDSTIVTAITKKKFQDLETYSIEYEGNKEAFVANKFQTSSDALVLPKVVEYYDVKHTYEEIDVATMTDMLKTTVILRDGPGMVDLDASLFYLAKKMKKRHTVALSGEGADEVFAGYPWYYREDEGGSCFPWLRNLDYRESLLKPEIRDLLKIKEYVNDAYEKIVSEVDFLTSDSEKQKEHRIMYQLNAYSFMQNLLTRKDRMTMGASLEVRIPFSDDKLFEYLYNVPFEYKYKDQIEKCLLRDAFKDELPEFVFNRKKNPYPKSHNKKYEETVIKLLKKCLKDKKSILHILFDEKKIEELFENNDTLIPWYGQLMTKPQLIAFLYQIDYWFKEYNVELRLE